MTKAEIIKAIQVAEAKAWDQFVKDKKTFGRESDITRESAKAWNPLYELRESLGIESLKASEAIAVGLDIV